MEPWIIAVIAGVGGAALGGVVAYLIADRHARAAVAGAETARAMAEQKAQSLETSLQAQQAVADSLREKMGEVEKQHAGVTAQLEASRQNIAEQRNLLDEANTRLTAAFAAVSREALEKSNASFLQFAEARFKTLSTEAAGTLEERKAQIATLLKPLEEMLGNYQKRLAEIETSRNEAYAALRQQIGTMNATQAALSTQTTQLVSALTRPSVRGQWGEIALRKLVELAGMTDRVDFTEQTSIDSEEGRLRPDMIVRMPGDRCAVIDCKAVLGAFLDAAGAADEAVRQQHLKRHAGLVRARVKDLASKAYWNQFVNTPDFAILFLPGESFLYAACEHDPDLIQDAIAQNILLATPTTLIALLRAIEFGWRQQALSENAEEIRTLGVEIYERIAVLAGNMSDLGKSIERAVDHYNKTVGSLESRVLVSTRKMSELGAHTERPLPEIAPIDKRPREFTPALPDDKSLPPLQ